jgi:phage terminase small subunit
MNDKLNQLSPSKRMFVLEYLKDFKPGKAAERVGLAASTGSGYLADVDIQEAVAEQMEQRAERTQIDADWVLIQLDKMFNADMADIFVPGSNDLKPIHEWPEVWRKMATAVKIDSRRDGEDLYHVKDVKILDRLKTLDMIGKHTNVKAFMDRIEVTTDQDLTNRLMAGRKRARDRNIKQIDTSDFM